MSSTQTLNMCLANIDIVLLLYKLCSLVVMTVAKAHKQFRLPRIHIVPHKYALTCPCPLLSRCCMRTTDTLIDPSNHIVVRNSADHGSNRFCIVSELSITCATMTRWQVQSPRALSNERPLIVLIQPWLVISTLPSKRFVGILNAISQRHQN